MVQDTFFSSFLPFLPRPGTCVAPDHVWPKAAAFPASRLNRYRLRGWGAGGAGPSGDRTDIRLDVRSDGRKFPPLFYRKSSPLGPLPKRMIALASL